MARAASNRGGKPRKPAAARPQAASRPPGRADTPWLEWAAAAVGLVLILAAIGVIGREMVAGKDGPPQISVRAGEVTETPDGYVVEVVARNSGGETAAQVVIEGELIGGAPEWREATLDYLPAGSERRAGLVFGADPRTHGLKLRAKGFVEP